MAISLSKKKSKLPKKILESRKNCFFSCLTKVLYPLPTALFFMILITLWSSSTTYISGRIVHVCVSSRKLSNLYCLSATTQPNDGFHFPFSNSSSEANLETPVAVLEEKVEKGKGFLVPVLKTHEPKEVSNGVLEHPSPVLEEKVEKDKGFLVPVLKTHEPKEVSYGVLEHPSPVLGEKVEKDKGFLVPVLKTDEPKEVSNGVLEHPSPVLEEKVEKDKGFLVPVLKTDEPKEVSNGVLEHPSHVLGEKVEKDKGFFIPMLNAHESKEVSNGVLEHPSHVLEEKVEKDKSFLIPDLNTHESKEVSNVVLETPNSVLREKVEKDEGFFIPVLNTHESKEVSNVVLENPNILENNLENDRIKEIKNAKKVVEEQLQLHRSWKSNQNHQRSCDGRGIYVYDLPPKFNKELVSQCHDMVPWLDLCKYFSNDALGEPMPELGSRWYQTHQYSLELIFHSRVLKHPCRVYDWNQAKLFYVPYYGGLDILRWHFKNVSNEVKDTLSLELVKWLDMQEPWHKNLGKDHAFVLGKISWDFRRKESYSWGTRFLELDQMQNPIKLMIERQPWEVNDIGIPHPTNFHPQSDEDIRLWQRKIISSHRKSFVSFAGAARPSHPDNIRSILINQCVLTSEDKCQFLNCSSGQCYRPESLVELFTESEFCLQPPGDSPTRKSVFDSLISGCIPVLFDPFTAYYQYPWHLPQDHGKYSIFIDQEEVREMKVNVVERLMKVPLKERDDMRRYIVYELMPRLVYGDQNAHFDMFDDAFTVTINNLIERVTRLGLN